MAKCTKFGRTVFLVRYYFVLVIVLVDGGGGHWLVRMEWHPAGWSVCLPLLIFPCTIKSRSSLLAPAHPGWSREKGRKTVLVVVLVMILLKTVESKL